MCPQFELAIEGSSHNLNEQAIALQSDDDETKQHPNVNKIASSRSLHYNPKTIKRSSTQNVKKIASSRSIQNESFSKAQRHRVVTALSKSSTSTVPIYIAELGCLKRVCRTTQQYLVQYYYYVTHIVQYSYCRLQYNTLRTYVWHPGSLW